MLSLSIAAALEVQVTASRVHLPSGEWLVDHRSYIILDWIWTWLLLASGFWYWLFWNWILELDPGTGFWNWILELDCSSVCDVDMLTNTATFQHSF